MRLRACAFIAAGLGWCATGLAQIPPTPGEYKQYTGLFAAAGANPNLADPTGGTALAIARARGYRDIVAVLENAGRAKP